MVLGVAAALAALLLWLVLLGPALKTWQKVPAERAKLEQDLLAVQALGLEVQALKASASLSFDAAYHALG